jgi:hypothetical protein
MRRARLTGSRSAVLLPRAARFAKRTVDHARAFALALREQGIARRARETRRLARGRTHDDLGKSQLLRDVAHDQRLLEILVAEVGARRMHDLEQAAHDRGDTGEVAATKCAFEAESRGSGLARRDAFAPAAGVREELLQRAGEEHVAARAVERRASPSTSRG